MNQRNQHSGHRLSHEDNGSMSEFPNAARLLVVDDEESLRITTAAILEREGYIVDTASSGDEAIRAASKTRIRPGAD
jgi:PleD family two-component response regulator